MYLVNFQRLIEASSNSPITALAMNVGTVYYSNSIKIDKNVGFMTLLLKEDKAGGAGDMDVYMEYSDDNITFYRPYTSDMAGTITQEGNVVTTLTNATRRIVFTPRMAKYCRVVFDPDANAQMTADLTFQEEV